MSARVVCISRTMAAGGEIVGLRLAQRLGFRYVDDQIITRAAELAQVDPRLVAQAEHRQSLLARLLDKLSAAQDLVGPMGMATVGLPVEFFVTGPNDYKATPDDLRALIRAAIQEVAREGAAVIVAHAASMALSDANDVLRVLITASVEARAQRIAGEQSLAPSEAAAAIAASDRERREYFLRFYKLKEELPTHYDLVVNTDRLTTFQVVDVIAAAVQSNA
jgi:cytidylate kinase